LRGKEPAGETEYLTDALGREAVAFIQKNKNRPWFLYLAFNAVHTPMHADDARLAKFAHLGDKQRQIYAAMMFAMDEAIGKVRKAIADSGQENNTLVIFHSDNGGPTMPGTTMNASSNSPLRGSKRTTLEGGIRVPFLLAWPGKVKPAIYDQPVIQLDAHTTALAAAGVAIQPDWKLDGVDLLPYLNGTKSGAPHDALYWRMGQQMAIRVGDYKLVRYDMNAETLTGAGGQPVSATKLYRLSNDIGEAQDLAASLPDKTKELESKWNAWNSTLATPLWGGGGGGKKGNKKKS
jgi:arylsulfatase A-like enzyme